MLRGIPVLKPYPNLHLHELDNNEFKPLKVGLRTTNVNPNDYLHCCVIGCHGNALLYSCLNTKVSCERLLGGGGNYFETSLSQ